GINMRNINKKQKIKNVLLYIFMVVLSLFIIFLISTFGIIWLLSFEIWFIFLYITCFILLLSAFWALGILLIKKSIFSGYITPKMKIVWSIDILLCVCVLCYVSKLLLAK
ncbi:MAG: hypothetical protein K6A44_05190, partial [bacterium]|nr:hypothetical protein [bacterium]